MSSLKQFLYNIVAGFSKNGKKDNKPIDTYPTRPYLEMEKEKAKKKIEDVKEEKYKKFQKDLVYFGTLKQQYLDKLTKQNKK